MRESVACERAGSREPAGVFVLHFSSGGCLDRCDDGQVEIDQVRVVYAVTLSTIDAVWIVADAAWGAIIDNMATVAREALVAENARLVVAFVA